MPGLFDTPVDKFLLRLLEKFGRIPNTPGQAIVPVEPPIGGGRGIPGYGQGSPPQGQPPRIGPGSGGNLSGGARGLGGGPVGGMWGGLGANTLPWVIAAKLAHDLAPEDDRRSDVPISPLNPASMFAYSDIAQSLFGEDKPVEPSRSPDAQAYLGGEAVEGRGDRNTSAVNKINDALNAARAAEDAEKAAIAGFKDSVDYDMAPEPLSNPAAGIAVEEIPSVILKRIRAQARAKGAAGSLGAPTEPDISIRGISDKLEPRELTSVSNLGPEQTPEALAAYLRKAPYDAALSDLTTREIYERDPSAVSRSNQLLGLAQEQRRGERQRSIDAMVDAVSGVSGKVPKEMVDKLRMLDSGIVIPTDKIGIGYDQAMRSLQGDISRAYEASSILSTRGEPGSESQIAILNQLDAVAQSAMEELQRPGSDPTEVIAKYNLAVSEIQSRSTQAARVFGVDGGGEEYTRVD